MRSLPAEALVLTCGAVTLRLATAADDDLLVHLMPDDFDHDPTFPLVDGRSSADHREAWLRHWLRAFRHPRHPGDRFAVFVVECERRPVGLQTLEGEHFDATREVETTSFLTPDARGRSLGVAMRTAVLAYAFEVWGATRAVTAARPDNVASKRVTERVGYTFVERREPLVAGSPRPIDCYAMTEEQWRLLDHLPVRIEGVGSF